MGAAEAFDEMDQLRAVQCEAMAKRGLKLSPDEVAFMRTQPAVAAIEAYRASVAARPKAPEPTRVRRWDQAERLEEAVAALVPGLRALRSPAETAMLLGFLTPTKARRVTLSPPDAILLTDPQGRALRLGMAVPSLNRVLDFALTGGNDKMLAIEVDGHAFHGSREAVQADKARDRQLMAADVETVRFTADEVFADPLGCAAEAFGLGLMKCSPFVVERPRAKR